MLHARTFRSLTRGHVTRARPLSQLRQAVRSLRRTVRRPQEPVRSSCPASRLGDRRRWLDGEGDKGGNGEVLHQQGSLPHPDQKKAGMSRSSGLRPTQASSEACGGSRWSFQGTSNPGSGEKVAKIQEEGGTENSVWGTPTLLSPLKLSCQSTAPQAQEQQHDEQCSSGPAVVVL